jgi:hypothetical protein
MTIFVNANARIKMKWVIVNVPKNGTLTHAHVDVKMPTKLIIVNLQERK